MTDRLQQIHEKSHDNRQEVEDSTLCGCFFCINVYPSEEIKDWCDHGLTAICPHCEIDAVIPGETDTNLLADMCEKYFTGISKKVLTQN